MKKLKKILLQNALVLEAHEMKRIYGGSGSGGSGSGGSGSGGDASICGSGNFSHVCECKSGPGTWCGDYSDKGESAIIQYCGAGNGECRDYR